MKRVVIALSLVCFVQMVFGQQTPLSREEYVKMLYALQKDPASKPALIEALRKRGIGFVVNDGLRSLTRSKGANDEEIKRALEEAERRRQDPVAAQLPSSQESTALLETATKKTLEAVGEMPDFVVKQQIQRSAAYAGTNNFTSL